MVNHPDTCYLEPSLTHYTGGMNSQNLSEAGTEANLGRNSRLCDRLTVV